MNEPAPEAGKTPSAPAIPMGVPLSGPVRAPAGVPVFPAPAAAATPSAAPVLAQAPGVAPGVDRSREDRIASVILGRVAQLAMIVAAFAGLGFGWESSGGSHVMGPTNRIEGTLLGFVLAGYFLGWVLVITGPLALIMAHNAVKKGAEDQRLVATRLKELLIFGVGPMAAALLTNTIRQLVLG